MPPWHEDGNARADELARSHGWRIALARLARLRTCGGSTGQRRNGVPTRLLWDCGLERLQVRVPIWSRSVASQFLLGRLHGRDGVGRLTLRFREVLDVILERVDFASEPVQFIVPPR